MDAIELDDKMGYFGMEKTVRKILVDENLATVNEVALMTRIEVCDKFLEYYEVVSCEDEDIAIVTREDMPMYNSIVKHLSC